MINRAHQRGSFIAKEKPASRTTAGYVRVIGLCYIFQSFSESVGLEKTVPRA